MNLTFRVNVMQCPRSRVFMRTGLQVASEDKAPFRSGNPDLSVCLPDRRTRRTVHKLNKNSMTATTTATDETRRGTTKYTVCPPAPAHPPPPDEVRRLRPRQKERERGCSEAAKCRKVKKRGRGEWVLVKSLSDHRGRCVPIKKKSKRRMKGKLLLRMDGRRGGKTQARK